MEKIKISGIKFNENCTQWNRNKDYNLMFLKSQQHYFNDVLAIRRHVFLNEVYDSLGLPRTKKGHLSGWLMNNGFVDFGINEIDDEIELTFEVIENLHEFAFEIEA